MNQKLRTKKQSGQILVVLLLIMVVGLTVGLFLLSRTTTDISLTTNISDSTRAFNAAEAGIEEAIRSTSGISQGSPVPVAEGVNYKVTTSDLGTSGIYPSAIAAPIEVGKIFTTWLVPHDEATGAILDTQPGYTAAPNQPGRFLDICYTNNTPNPAIAVTVYYREGAQYRSSYVGYDHVAARRSQNGFLDTLAAGPCAAAGYDRRARVDFGSGATSSHFGPNLLLRPPARVPVSLRIRPVYNSTSIAVLPFDSAVNPLPKQGNQIDSTGSVGEIVRRINVDEPYTVPAPFLDHAVYSTGANSNLEK